MGSCRWLSLTDGLLTDSRRPSDCTSVGGKKMPALLLFSPLSFAFARVCSTWRRAGVRSRPLRRKKRCRTSLFCTASHNAFSSNSALGGTQCCSECLGAAQTSIISYLRCPEDADVPSLTPLSARRKKKFILSYSPARFTYREPWWRTKSSEPSPVRRSCAHTHARTQTHMDSALMEQASSLQQAPTSQPSPSSSDITSHHGNPDSTPVRSWTYLSDYQHFITKSSSSVGS